MSRELIQDHPDRGEPKEFTRGVGRALTIEEYRKNINKRMISDVMADRFRWECLQQPNWRRDMQLDEDYYDGHQLNTDVLEELDERGIPPIVTNLVGPTVDVILGMEAQSRRDFIVRPEEDPQWDDVAMALGQKLKEAERLSCADHACSEAYDRQVKGGLGWVAVTRETDPHRYRYKAEYVDWREIDYDPMGRRMDTRDWRFLRRMKFFDRDHLEAIFPRHAKVIHELGSGAYHGGSVYADSRQILEAELLRGGSHGPWRDYTLTDMDYIDWDRDRLQLEEIWYRVWVQGQVLDLPDLTSVVYDNKNPAHNYMAETGRAKMRVASWPEMRMAYWIGPLCVGDVPSPLPHRDFPYVPFFGMREGRTGVPYGVIRRMRPMQDEVNARTSKMLWALSARRVIADPNAVMDHDAARHEVSRPDAYIMLNPKRKPSDRFEVEDNIDISSQQFQVLQDRIQRLQDVAGVYNAMLGKKDSGAESGVAINSLIDQGTTTLAPLNDNYMLGRAEVGDRLLAHIIADMGGMRNVPVQVDSARGKRTIVLNQPTVHEQTKLEVVQNNVQKARIKVALDDIPATSTFRQQQFNRIADLLGKMATFAPETAVKMLDMLVEVADVPNRQEYVDRIREISGIPKDPASMSPEERQAFMAQQQQQQREKALMERAALAEIGVDEGKAAESMAKAQKTAADTEQTLVQIQQIMETMRLTSAKAEETQAKTASILQDIQAQQAALAATGGVPDKQEAVYRW